MINSKNIIIDSNTNTISTDAASQLNELSDCKSGGVNFENCLYLGTTTTGTLNNATDNIAIGLNALNRLTTGDNNIAIGHNALDKCASKTNNVAPSVEKNKSSALSTLSDVISRSPLVTIDAAEIS